MIPASELPPNTRLVDLAGPLVVGYLLHWGLFGTLNVQIYLYYEAFPADKLTYKLFVYGLYAVELVQTILVSLDAFDVFGYGFGDMRSLMAMHHNWLIVPIMSGLVALASQTFYAHRIFLLSESWKIPSLIITISLLGAVGGVVTGTFNVLNGDLGEIHDRDTSISLGIWGSAAAFSDIMIAVCMTYYLAKHDSGFRRTHAIVSKFIRLTIETGSATAVTAIVNLIIFYSFPGRLYYSTSGMIITKLYANSILVVLNARFQIRHGRSAYGSSSDPMTSVFPSFIFLDTHNASSNGVCSSSERTAVSIKETVLLGHVSDKPIETRDIIDPRDGGST
ncbi:hypothetical protein BDZ94DRAFT_604012 [Collybia nuda]|uniref:DUF6534 domain-containing protein n=1 Tax=Collybia nuda TaxID=64659 RepID=A0A9P5Y8A6_9AGAR|nr:hypothetical protein BDZ94DRAFT_604012 [Collybia nuda]